MPRISEKQIIIDQDTFNALLPRYLSMIEELQKKYIISDGSEYESLVNFKTNITTPKHNWFLYKQGYAEDLIKKLIEECSPAKDSYILDPFCGVGTTNLVAQSLGFKSIGFDINPVAVLASRVKTSFYSNKDKVLIKKYITDFNPNKRLDLNNVPKVILTSFLEENLDALLKIRYFVDSLGQNPKLQAFFMLAFLSIIEDASLKTKDGNGLKLNTNKKQIKNVFGHFITKCESMLLDIGKSNYPSEATVFNESLFSFKNSSLADYTSKISLSIFSPPYANCFDYCEVYKLEFWLGGYVKAYDDFKFYRNMAMRSHVNSSFNHTFKYLNPDVDLTAKLISSFNIWNKNIPDMIRGYFDDTYQLLKKMYPLFSKNGKCIIVVANSGYRGVLVPTDLFIAEIASEIGFKVESINNVRKIRASSQQMDLLHNNYKYLMRESIIVLKK